MSRYQAYPEYEKSDVPWIGTYPWGWALTRVKFDSYVKARVGWHGLKSDDFTDEGPYLVTGSDFNGPEIRWENCYHCDLARYDQDPYIQLNESDLLITKDGTIGKVALVRGLNGKATLNSGVFVVRPLGNKYTTKYYFWLLQSNVFHGFVDFNKTGSTIVHLYQDTFVNFKYALPSFDEQLVIADFLDHETAKIDALIEKQQRLIELLKEKRQAVISHAVTKGLNPNVPMKDSGVEWLGDVPAHWHSRQLKYLCSYNDEVLSETVGDDFEIEYVDIGSVSAIDGISGTETLLFGDAPSRARRIVRDGDILISTVRTYLEAIASIQAPPNNLIASTGFAVIRPNVFLNKGYAAYCLRASGFIKEVVARSVGVSYPAINASDLVNIKTPEPSPTEQEEIAAYLDHETAKMDALLEKASTGITLLQERRTALISAAVTGKIDVRDWQAAA